MNRQGLLAATTPFSGSELSFPSQLSPNHLGSTNPPNGKISNLCKSVKKYKKFFRDARGGHSEQEIELCLLIKVAAQAFQSMCPCRLPPPPKQAADAVDKEVLVIASERADRRSLGPGPRHSRKNPEAEGSANFSSALSSCGQGTKPVPSRSRGHHGSQPLRASAPVSHRACEPHPSPR